MDLEAENALSPAWAHHNKLRHLDGDNAAALAFARLATDDAEKMMIVSVIHARRTGLSWSQVGEILGVTKQAAQQRYGRHCGES